MPLGYIFSSSSGFLYSGICIESAIIPPKPAPIASGLVKADPIDVGEAIV